MQLPDLLGLACGYARPLACLLQQCPSAAEAWQSQTAICPPARCASEDVQGLANIMAGMGPHVCTDCPPPQT